MIACQRSRGNFARCGWRRWQARRRNTLSRGGNRRRGGIHAIQRGRILAIFQNQSDYGVNLDGLGTIGHQNSAEHAFIDGFDFHGGLVGFDLRQYVARCDGIALFLVPGGEIALRHGGR